MNIKSFSSHLRSITTLNCHIQSSTATYQEKHGIFFMEQRLTCANHSDEEIVLDQIGWNNFNCPKCGNDYSLGRKVIVLDPKLIQQTYRH